MPIENENAIRRIVLNELGKTQLFIRVDGGTPATANISFGTNEIKDFSVDVVPLKLLEMGCLPGNEVSLVQAAPFSDPLYLTINGSHLAIRKEMASQIEIELING